MKSSKETLAAQCDALQVELDVLRGTFCAEEQANGDGPCGACLACARNKCKKLQALLELAERAIVRCSDDADRTPEAGSIRQIIREYSRERSLHQDD